MNSQQYVNQQFPNQPNQTNNINQLQPQAEFVDCPPNTNQQQYGQQPQPNQPQQSSDEEEQKYMIENLSHQVSVVTQNLASIGDYSNLQFDNSQYNAAGAGGAGGYQQYNQGASVNGILQQQDNLNIESRMAAGPNQQLCSQQRIQVSPVPDFQGQRHPNQNGNQFVSQMIHPNGQDGYQSQSQANSAPQTERIFRENTFKNLGHNSHAVWRKACNGNENGVIGLPQPNNQNIEQMASPFESEVLPAIPAGLYLNILCQKLSIPDEHAIIILVLIERVCHHSEIKYEEAIKKGKPYFNKMGDPNSNCHRPWKVEINSKTIHRLILVSVLMTQKFYTDFVWANQFVAEIGGLSSVHELNTLELFFLDLLDWEVLVTEQEYYQYYKDLTKFFSSPLPKLTKDVFDDIQKAISQIEIMYDPENGEAVDPEQNPMKLHPQTNKSNANVQQQQQQQQQQQPDNANQDLLMNLQMQQLQQIHNQQMNSQVLQYLLINQILREKEIQENQNQNNQFDQINSSTNNSNQISDQNGAFQQPNYPVQGMQELIPIQQSNALLQQILSQGQLQPDSLQLILNQINQQVINQQAAILSQQPIQPGQVDFLQQQAVPQQMQPSFLNNPQIGSIQQNMQPINNLNEQQQMNGIAQQMQNMSIYQQNNQAIFQQQQPQNNQQIQSQYEQEDDFQFDDVDEMVDEQELQQKVLHRYIGNNDVSTKKEQNSLNVNSSQFQSQRGVSNTNPSEPQIQSNSFPQNNNNGFSQQNSGFQHSDQNFGAYMNQIDPSMSPLDYRSQQHR